MFKFGLARYIFFETPILETESNSEKFFAVSKAGPEAVIGVGFTGTPLFQTNFFPDLMQVKVLV